MGHIREHEPICHWQDDYIGPLPLLKGYKYMLTYMNTAPGLLLAFPCKWNTHNEASSRDLNGTLFSRVLTQIWVEQHDMVWSFQLPCNPTAAGLIKQSKEPLKTETSSLRGGPPGCTRPSGPSPTHLEEKGPVHILS